MPLVGLAHHVCYPTIHPYPVGAGWECLQFGVELANFHRIALEYSGSDRLQARGTRGPSTGLTPYAARVAVHAETNFGCSAVFT